VVVLLDTDQLSAADRRPARVADRLQASMVSQVHVADADSPVRARLDAWDLSCLRVLRADLSGGFSLAGTPRQARQESAPVLSLAFLESGAGRHGQFGAQRLLSSGDLTLTDLASPYENQWIGPVASRALQIPADRLRLPMDVVRRALPAAQRSPLFALVRTHVEHLTRDAERLAREPLVHALAATTVDLTRALLSSAAGLEGPATDLLAETLLARVRGYVRQHLTDADLDAATIARAHAVSVRQLYRLCSAADFSLEQWIIQQRLDGARDELRSPGSRERSVAMVARRWGFTDPSYFSRRFRSAYGTTPRNWRLLGPEPVVAATGG
jgi:AraC-like DNA-binding protein